MTTKFTSLDATEEISSSSSSDGGGGVNSEKKSCAICGTSKTPLWRGGPTGPKVWTLLDLHLTSISPIRSDLIWSVWCVLCSRYVTHAGSGTRRRRVLLDRKLRRRRRIRLEIQSLVTRWSRDWWSWGEKWWCSDRRLRINRGRSSARKSKLLCCSWLSLMLLLFMLKRISGFELK